MIVASVTSLRRQLREITERQENGVASPRADYSSSLSYFGCFHGVAFQTACGSNNPSVPSGSADFQHYRVGRIRSAQLVPDLENEFEPLELLREATNKFGLGDARSSAGLLREPLYIFSQIRSENTGSSSMHSAASSCSTMAATIGGVPRAAPMPVSPVSVSTRMSVASLFDLGSKVGAVTLFLRNGRRHWNRGHFDDFHGSLFPGQSIPSILDGLRSQIAECHTPRCAKAHLFGQPSRPRPKIPRMHARRQSRVRWRTV